MRAIPRPARSGLDLLARIRTLADSTVPVVVMTAWAPWRSPSSCCTRRSRLYPEALGQRPLLAISPTQVELSTALKRGQRLEAENRLLRTDGRPNLIAGSPAMQPVIELISRVGPSDANVLITGEPGTGKEVVARMLYAVSGRASRPMVTVNAGGLSEGIFESELFGHVKGAFTDAKVDRVGRFELADGGTLFLDEIANVPMNLQAKSLRVPETGEMAERVGSSKTKRVDARVISATNAILAEEVASGRFRQDLLFRLNTIEIHLPPLRERREDIPVLAAHFLTTHARCYRKDLQGFDQTAMQALLDNPWQGNVRELNHVVERAVLMAREGTVRPADLALRASAAGSAWLEDMSLEDVEFFLIKKALARHNGNVSQAAGTLGLSRAALYRRLERFGL